LFKKTKSVEERPQIVAETMNYEEQDHDIESLDDDEPVYEEVKKTKYQEPTIFDPLSGSGSAKRKAPVQKLTEQKEESKSNFVSKRISEMENQDPLKS
jgi:hypothetical protein